LHLVGRVYNYITMHGFMNVKFRKKLRYVVGLSKFTGNFPK